MRITITGVKQGVCEMTGKEGEVVVIQTDDQPVPAEVSFKTLQEMVRFRAKQELKQEGPDPAAPHGLRTA
jgi:hypothetical protein